MQEQHQYKMTPEQGWLQMSTILDEAMPVTKRSRRFIAYWWSAAAVVGVALVSIFALLDINSDNTPHYQTQTKPVTEIEASEIPASTKENTEVADVANTQETITQETDNNTATSSITAAEGNRSTSTPNTNTHQRNNDLSLEQENKTNQVRNSLGSESKHDVFAQQENNANNGSTIFIEPESGDIATQATIGIGNGDNVSTSQVRNSNLISLLPSLGIDEIEREQNEIAAITVEPSVRRMQKLVPYLAAGMLRTFSNGLGINASLGLNVNLTNKLSVTSALGYQYYDPEASLLSINSDELNQSDVVRNHETIGDYLPADLVNNSSNAVINPFVKSLRHWQLSAGLKYALTGRLSIEAGGIYGFGIVAKSSYPIAAIDIYDPGTGFVPNVSTSFNSFNKIPSSTTSLYGGIAYKLSPNTEVFAQVVHGLNHYLLDAKTLPSAEVEKRTDQIQGVNVGFKYSLVAGP